jgi:hypothetical protein
MELKFQGFSIKLKDFVEYPLENGKMFITDARIKAEEFDSFLSFYKDHNRKGKYFNTVLNNKGFYGRFGQIVYSPSDEYYDLRLVFVESIVDGEQSDFSVNKFVLDVAEYQNMLDTIAKQEVILTQLKDVLENKGILTREEVESIFTVEEQDKNAIKFELGAKVKDLDEYLNEQKDTLNHIRKELEEN